MKVLILSPYSDRLLKAITACGDESIITEGPISASFCIESKVDYIVSYGYRFILTQKVLESVSWNAVNLHISLLPYARGAHPIFWSILEGRPVGVTIHRISKGLDTGDILLQQKLDLNIEAETFRSCYTINSDLIEKLFIEKWELIRVNTIPAAPQSRTGSYHRASMLEAWRAYLPLGWDTPIDMFKYLAKESDLN